MPLMTSKPMFDLAYNGGFAVGAFNVNNMELCQAIIDACAKESSPLILQISKGARKYANIRYLKKIIDAGVDDFLEIANVGVFSRAFADLKNQRARFLGTGVNDGLAKFHVIYVESTDCEAAVVGEIEHR